MGKWSVDVCTCMCGYVECGCVYVGCSMCAHVEEIGFYKYQSDPTVNRSMKVRSYYNVLAFDE